jgi:ABC-type amino acid transport substrate-binding protein
VAAVALGVVALTITGARAYFSFAVGNTYDESKLLALMQPLFPAGPAKVYKTPPPTPPSSAQSILKRIRTRGVLRVGYLSDRRPFSFFNEQGELVGLDIEMARILASLLGVGVEFVPVTHTTMFEQLNQGYCDIIMSGIAPTPDRTEVVRFSVPYMDLNMAFVVLDYRRGEFATREALSKLKAPRLAILNVPYFVAFARERMPQAELVTVNSPEEFFRSNDKNLDGFIYTAEEGSAWSLLYPQYTVVVVPPAISIPLSYPVAHNDEDLADYVNVMLDLKKRDGTLKELYDYWVFGQFATRAQPRWSVIRNVLHWVK